MDEENYGDAVPAFRPIEFGYILESTRNINSHHKKNCCSSFCTCGAESLKCSFVGLNFCALTIVMLCYEARLMAQ